MKKVLSLLFIALLLNTGILLNVAQAQNTSEAGTYYNNATEKISKKDFKGALQDLNKAINLVSNEYELYNTRGYVKSMLYDYLGAIQDCNKVIQLKPDYADGYYNRALSKADLKDYTGAITDLEKAKALYLKQNNKTGYDDSVKKITKFQSLK